MSKTKITLGARIRAFRQSKKLTQAELAAVLEVGQPDLCCWEGDKRRPGKASIEKLKKVTARSKNHRLVDAHFE
jgi:transcriptional regulator with XRE-family HTH domain